MDLQTVHCSDSRLRIGQISKNAVGNSGEQAQPARYGRDWQQECPCRTAHGSLAAANQPDIHASNNPGKLLRLSSAYMQTAFCATCRHVALTACHSIRASLTRVAQCLRQNVCMQEEGPEEVSVLKTEVAQLQMQLATTTEQLEAANAAAEAERSTTYPHFLRVK